MSKAFALDSSYINLRPDDSTTVLKVGPRFWSSIDKRTDLDDGRLMGKTRQRRDWAHWERHPAGDEILVLLSGELELVLQTPRGERHARLKAGQAFVVPKGLWHRGIVRKPGELMFITPGAGTEHRPVTL